MRVSLAVACLVWAFWVTSAQAQYIFLDVNGDGASSAADSLSPSDNNTVDIWLRTDENRDGSTVLCGGGSLASRTESPDTVSATEMTINSYEVVLHANDGTVDWGTFTNTLGTAGTALGPVSDSTDVYVGFAGLDQLTPGTYRIGSIHFVVRSGRPSISVAAGANIGGTEYRTTFGSACPGLEFNNTLALGADWFDADGLSPSVYAEVWSDNFDDGQFPVSHDWYTDDYDERSGWDYWGSTDDYCGHTYNQSSHSVGASSNSDNLFCTIQYDAYQDAVLESPALDMTNCFVSA